jgi:hypothetical protein
MRHYTVWSSSFTASVAARSAIAIYTGALGTGSTGSTEIVAVTFQVYATTTYGDSERIDPYHIDQKPNR